MPINAPLTLTLTTADALRIASLAVQRYDETHPRPSSVTQKEAALMIGVSGATH